MTLALSRKPGPAGLADRKFHYNPNLGGILSTRRGEKPSGAGTPGQAKLSGGLRGTAASEEMLPGWVWNVTANSPLPGKR